MALEAKEIMESHPQREQDWSLLGTPDLEERLAAQSFSMGDLGGNAYPLDLNDPKADYPSGENLLLLML